MRHTLSRKELAADSIRLAQAIPDTVKRNACIAAAFAFASRYLDANETNKLLEVLKMIDLGTMLVTSAQKEKAVEIAITMINDGMGISTISKYTGLDEATVRQLQAELQAA